MEVSFADIAPPHSLFPLFADKHKDGTAIIMELEKGLRSQKIGDQCESIAFFARLIAQYPFAVVVNTAALKLADLFRQSNNFVRLCIVRVFQSCEEQLLPGNILNLDEILRRITSVLHSNDPIARALALRLLASLSLLVSDRLDVQHWIRKCFDSQSMLETDAALGLMDRVAARSESFCMAMISKAGETIDALETPMATKLRLMRLYRHMHHSSALAHEAEARCSELLLLHTLRGSTVALLDSLTSLAEQVAALAPKHINRLWQVVSTDPRRVVQLHALKCLARLAARPRGVFPLSTEQLWGLIETSFYDDIKLAAAQVLSALASAAADEFFTLQDVPKYAPLLHVKNAELSSAVAHVLAMIVTHPVLISTSSLIPSAAATVVSQLCLGIALRTGEPTAQLPYAPLMRVLRTHAFCRQSAFEALFPLLLATSSSPIHTASAVARLLASLVSIDPATSALVADRSRLLISELGSRTDVLFLQHLCELLLRVAPHSSSLSGSLLPSLERAGGWATYLLARSALCSSAPAVAAEAFQALIDKAGTEQYLSWLLALRDMARAELRSQASNGLNQALSILASCVTHLHGAASASSPMSFQSKLLALRRSFLTSVASLRLLLQEVPRTPVLLYTIHTARLRAVADRVAGVRRVFSDLAADFTLLAHSFFDIDSASCAALQSHANLCLTIAMLLRLWFESNDASTVTPLPTGGNLKLDLLCDRLISEAPRMGPELSARAEALLEAVNLLCAQPPPYPRFFFRASVGTHLKLTIAPRPPSHSEALLVQSSVTVALRISGVLCPAPHVRRHAHRVSLVIRVTEVSQGLKLKNLRLDHVRGTEVSQHVLRARLRHNAFSTSCLLRFPVPGRTYLISLQPALISTGVEWPVPPEALFVKTTDIAGASGGPAVTTNAPLAAATSLEKKSS